MKRILLIICFFSCTLTVKPQLAVDSLELTHRLDSFIYYNRAMEFERILDFTYPKLFTIAPREQVKKELEKAFNNDEIDIRLDSLQIVRVYPIFESGDGKYARVTYSMLINMSPKLNDEEIIEIGKFLESVQKHYGEKNVWLDGTGKGINIFQEVDMAAVIDEFSPAWTFTNLVKDEPFMEMLFSKELIDRFYSN